jgi:hypothetical protein
MADNPLPMLPLHPDDRASPISFIQGQVLEDGDNPTDITVAVGMQRRFTAADIVSFDVEFYFPQGLYQYNHDGKLVPMDVSLQIGYRPTGTSTWTYNNVTVTAKQAKPIFRQFSFAPPTRGQYEITVLRLGADTDDADLSTTKSQAKTISRCTWTAVRSHRPEYPLNYPIPVTLVAVKIRATGQLNGTLNSLNILASCQIPDWDAASGTWITRFTQNPASFLRYAEQGPHAVDPLDDDELDLEAIQDWHEFCSAKGLRYNAVQSEERRKDDVIAEICAAGRAIPLDLGDKRSIIIDRPRTLFVDHCRAGTPQRAVP